MAIPPTTVVWPEPMDPYDVTDYTVDVSNLLQPDEKMASYTLSLPAESLLLGLTLGVDDYASTVEGNVIRMWLSTSKPNDTAFDNAGVTLPIELTVTTSSRPARRRQRTLGVKVVQK